MRQRKQFFIGPQQRLNEHNQVLTEGHIAGIEVELLRWTHLLMLSAIYD